MATASSEKKNIFSWQRTMDVKSKTFLLKWIASCFFSFGLIFFVFSRSHLVLVLDLGYLIPYQFRWKRQENRTTVFFGLNRVKRTKFPVFRSVYFSFVLWYLLLNFAWKRKDEKNLMNKQQFKTHKAISIPFICITLGNSGWCSGAWIHEFALFWNGWK